MSSYQLVSSLDLGDTSHNRTDVKELLSLMCEGELQAELYLRLSCQDSQGFQLWSLLFHKLDVSDLLEVYRRVGKDLEEAREEIGEIMKCYKESLWEIYSELLEQSVEIEEEEGEEAYHPTSLRSILVGNSLIYQSVIFHRAGVLYAEEQKSPGDVCAQLRCPCTKEDLRELAGKMETMMEGWIWSLWRAD